MTPRRRRPSPLPIRDGVDPTRAVLRHGPEFTVLDALLAIPSLARLTVDDLRRRSGAGEILGADGRPVDLDAPSTPNDAVYLYRDLPDEHEVPFALPTLHLDEDLLVVDKPHFLATMPRGQHVTQTALVRLRRELRDVGGSELAPAHRLDRLTAGVLLFTRRAAVRAAYQELFAQRQVYKEYRAVAPADERLRTEVTVANRIEKTAGDLRARVIDGPVNAVSAISLLDLNDDGMGVYRLVPQTGRTHQLRLHMAGLGVGIADDPLYPDIRRDLAARPQRGDFTAPLRLLAQTLAFDDPHTGQRREFRSQRSV